MKKFFILKSVLIFVNLGRFVAKRLRLEGNPLLLWVHRKLMSATFIGKEGPCISVKLNNKILQVPRDISILPGILNGTYEKFEIEFLKKQNLTGKVFIDVGANFGLYSAFATDLVGKEGLVLAFEPIPATFELLHRNLAVYENVEVFNLAVGDRDGTIQMNYTPSSPGCSSALGDGPSKFEVPIVTLDQILSSRGMRADFVKIDVEGLELAVLRGLSNSLSKDAIVLCEFNPSFLRRMGQEPQAFIEYLQHRFSRIDFIDDFDGSVRPLRNLQSLRGQLIANLVLSNN